MIRSPSQRPGPAGYAGVAGSPVGVASMPSNTLPIATSSPPWRRLTAQAMRLQRREQLLPTSTTTLQVRRDVDRLGRHPPRPVAKGAAPSGPGFPPATTASSTRRRPHLRAPALRSTHGSSGAEPDRKPACARPDSWRAPDRPKRAPLSTSPSWTDHTGTRRQPAARPGPVHRARVTLPHCGPHTSTTSFCHRASAGPCDRPVAATTGPLPISIMRPGSNRTGARPDATPNVIPGPARRRRDSHTTQHPPARWPVRVTGVHEEWPSAHH